MEFTSIFLNKICKIERKYKQTEVLLYLKKILGTSCGYELFVTSCRGHEMLVYQLFKSKWCTRVVIKTVPKRSHR